jgi:hypothetical protein
MQLASRLSQTTLGDLLASLYRAGASGVLELIEPHARHAIHLRRGCVQAVESGTAAARLGDLAARTKRISRPELERARFVAMTRGLRIGQAMVATNLLSPLQLDELLTLQRRERLERLFTLGDAHVRFRVARPLPPGASEQLPLGARDVFHGRPRRRGESERSARSRTSTHEQSRPFALAFAELGVRPDATFDQARSAFRKRVFELHPDRAVDATETERAQRARKLASVIDAYRTIVSRIGPVSEAKSKRD